jgi:hypothetical protein
LHVCTEAAPDGRADETVSCADVEHGRRHLCQLCHRIRDAIDAWDPNESVVNVEEQAHRVPTGSPSPTVTPP